MTLWERRVPTLWWLAGVIAVTAFVVALFPAVSQSAGIQEVMQAFPPELLALYGIDPAVLQTAAGYLQAQFYSFAAAILLVVLGGPAGGEGDCRRGLCQDHLGGAGVVLVVAGRAGGPDRGHVSFWPTVAAGQDALFGLIDPLPRELTGPRWRPASTRPSCSSRRRCGPPAVAVAGFRGRSIAA